MSGASLMRLFQQRSLTASEEAELELRMDRVRRDVRDGRPEPDLAPPVDPYVVRQFEEAVQQGWDKKPEAWRQVMEYHGFRWYEPEELDRLVGLQQFVPRTVVDEAGNVVPNYHNAIMLRPNPVGQWRNDPNDSGPPSLRQAFTLYDLIAGFGAPPGGPEVFDRWRRDQVQKHRAAAAGIVLPRPPR